MYIYVYMCVYVYVQNEKLKYFEKNYFIYIIEINWRQYCEMYLRNIVDILMSIEML